VVARTRASEGRHPEAMSTTTALTGIEGGLLLQVTEILAPQRGDTAPAERMVGWRGLGCAYRLGPVTYTWGAAAWVASKKAPKHAAALRDMETATEGSEE